jgi:hypothetical protein
MLQVVGNCSNVTVVQKTDDKTGAVIKETVRIYIQSSTSVEVVAGSMDSYLKNPAVVGRSYRLTIQLLPSSRAGQPPLMWLQGIQEVHPSECLVANANENEISMEDYLDRSKAAPVAPVLTKAEQVVRAASGEGAPPPVSLTRENLLSAALSNGAESELATAGGAVAGKANKS